MTTQPETPTPEALLFDVPEQLSPRLAEERKALERAESLGIKTHFSDSMPGEEWMAIFPFKEDQTKSVGEMMADHCRLYDEASLIVFGTTRTEAILSLAEKLGPNPKQISL